MPRPKKSTTPVEKMIVAAILMILFSVVMPNLQRTQRRARTASHRHAATVARHEPPEPAGQLNTIEVGETSSKERRSSPGPGARLIGALVPLLMTVIAVSVIIRAVRRGLGTRAQQ